MQMLTIDDLFEYYHQKPLRDNDKIALEILEEFQNIIGFHYDFIMKDNKPLSLEDSMVMHIMQLRSLKYCYKETSAYYRIYHELLRKYHYNYLIDIREAVIKIGNSLNPASDTDLIKKLLLSPVIDDISFKGNNSFKIFSEQYGSFEFIRFEDVFKSNEKVIDYFNNSENISHCHDNAKFLSSVFPKFYTITSLTPSYFTGYNYHSYTYDLEDDLVIDANSKVVCSKDNYDSLMHPQELMHIKNSRMSKYIKLISGYAKKHDINEVFCIALMMQLKSMKRKDRKILAREISNS